MPSIEGQKEGAVTIENGLAEMLLNGRFKTWSPGWVGRCGVEVGTLRTKI